MLVGSGSSLYGFFFRCYRVETTYFIQFIEMNFWLIYIYTCSTWSTLVFSQEEVMKVTNIKVTSQKRVNLEKAEKELFFAFQVKKKYPFIKDYLWKQSCQIPRVPLISSPFSSTLGATFFFNPIMAKKSFSTKIYFRI